ncbi:EmrB/QacA subfamily drug resistance transporter [Prauserella shujinwangii]|uniref:EmrB/QacA subfamily drug resistance transporter n=1 Tax=Prauserella shujinwangii TaxID=1453103 RepID=A0A2T0LTA0_9PSEU|nr:MFS transporter [Prauserella shujinwangii]PRX46960.1 EmrB/QacA subfamily drug resistance transporter [Prauserella shujinwangii]
MRRQAGDPPLPAAGTSERVTARQWLVLAVVLSGFFLILLDGTIMNAAIPPIQRDLATTFSAAQWMMSGYALAFGVVLITAGRLGDRFGYKRLFLTGLAAFTVASALCAIATTGAEIVFYRAVQGVAAGVMNPAVLAMIRLVFPENERGRAFVWYGAVAGIAASVGPVLGGLIISTDLYGLGWRPIFLLNIPIGIVTLACGMRWLPEHRGRAGSLDLVGVGLLSATLVLLLYPLIQGYETGWPGELYLLLLLSVVLGLGFVWWQRYRLREGTGPVVDIRLFGNRSFAAGVGVAVFQFVAFAGMQFALSAYLQLGLGQSALATGLALAPFAVGTFVGSTLSNVAVRRLGRAALHWGSGLMAAGTAATALTIQLVGGSVDGLWLSPSTFVTGVGAMLLGAPIINIILTDVRSEEAGSAGGIVGTAQRVGHALGVALVGTVLFGLVSARSGAGLVEEYTTAIQLATLCCTGAALVSHVLIYRLPRR